jgi:hypothetical protein
VLVGVDLGDEVLVPGEDDDHDQRGRERQIDKAQGADDDVGLARAQAADDEMDKLLRRLDEEHDQRHHQPDIERREEPAA